MKVFSCIAILVSVLSLASCCEAILLLRKLLHQEHSVMKCLPLKSALWDCKTRKMDELMSKMDFLLEKKLELKSKLEMFKQRKSVMGFCGKLPSNCELVFGTPIEQCKPSPVAAYYPQQCGSCCRY